MHAPSLHESLFRIIHMTPLTYTGLINAIVSTELKKNWEISEQQQSS